jgi:tRNA(His) 5'-end guanylyltransferase
VWQVPTIQEALEVFVWREDDAVKNSISMAASVFYSHRELHGKNGSEKQELLFQKGVNWNNYPASFKRGTYLQRKTEDRVLTDEEWLRIPNEHRPSRDQTFSRSRVVELDLPPVRRITNAAATLFTGALPESHAVGRQS